MTELVRYEAARRRSPRHSPSTRSLEIRDHAEAMRHAARIAKDRDLEIKAAQIRFRADRRLGELIKAQKETVGLAHGRGRLGEVQRVLYRIGAQKISRPTLSDVGIDRKLPSQGAAGRRRCRRKSSRRC